MIYLITIGIIVVLGIVMMLVQGKGSDDAAKLRMSNITKNGFTPSKVSEISGGITLCVDEEKKKFIYINDKGSNAIIPFENIIACEVVKNGQTITKNSVGGAIIGGALAGGVGAIIGSGLKAKSKEKIDTLDLVITIDDINSPVRKFRFYDSQWQINIDKCYDLIDEWNAVFKVVLSRNDRQAAV